MTDDELCADVHANLCRASNEAGRLGGSINAVKHNVKLRIDDYEVPNNELRREGGNLRYTARKLRELADYIDTTAEMLESL